jgi:hypothetical protein
MKVLTPIRQKRKRALGPEAPPASASPPAEEPPSGSPPSGSPSSLPRGLLRKSAIRRFLKHEFNFPLQIRETFFAAAEARFAEDLRRSVARARELTRNTLMGPDA